MATPNSIGCTAVLDTRLRTERSKTPPSSLLSDSPGIRM